MRSMLRLIALPTLGAFQRCDCMTVQTLLLANTGSWGGQRHDIEWRPQFMFQNAQEDVTPVFHLLLEADH